MKDIAGLIAKAAEKTGFHRDFFKEDNMPTDPSNITLIPFFGDIRSLFILSSLLLHRYKEQDKPSKYIILCSWPGFSSLFPYLDEYWSIQSDLHIKKLYPSATGFDNKSELVGQYYRSLNQYFFEDVVDVNWFAQYYNFGLTDAFFQKYKVVKRFLPSVPSGATLGKDFNRDFMGKGGYKVFVYPAAYITTWYKNHSRLMQVPKDFWNCLIKRLLSAGFIPVICKNFATYDLSAEFSENCIYFSENDVGKILAVMRMTNCVLDIFTGIACLAMASRSPFLSVDDRGRYVGLKEYELNDLCSPEIPKKFIFSFSTIIEGGSVGSWDFDILNSLVARLHSFLPVIDRERLPPTGYSLEEVPYNLVRTRKLKRLGTRLLKIPKED